MKKTLLFIIFAFVSSAVNAQGIGRARSSLDTPAGSSGARIEVRETPDAALAIAAADHNGRVTRVMTYSVSLFRDNSQTAGANARAVASRFADMYGDIPVEVSYESPYFMVTAGSFIDRTSALALCGKVVGAFPKAVVVQEEVGIEKIVSRGAE